MKITPRQKKTYRHDSHAVQVKCGEEYFNVLENLINKARYEIQFQTYIFDSDETGKKIKDALVRAAERGVNVFLVVDSFGASLSYSFIHEMISAGIYFRKFSPFFSQKHFQVGRRLHHKVVVIDEKKALISGINIADKYRGTKTEKPWLDFAVLLEGNICKELASVCRRIERKKMRRTKEEKKHHTNHAKEKNPLIRYRRSDWVRRKSQIRESYKTAIKNAEHSITIVAAYFIPGITLRRALKKAASRGVQVKLILSEKSDVPFIKNAHRFLYGWLFHIHIRVFEYQPVILHGKAMIVDNEWATIGSYNINHLSDYSSIELNADILSKEFASSFQEYIDDIISGDCIEITERMNRRRNYFHHFFNWFSYQLVRLNMSLLFFFITKRGSNRLE